MQKLYLSSFGKYPDRDCHTHTHTWRHERARQAHPVEAGVDSDEAGVASIQHNVKGLGI